MTQHYIGTKQVEAWEQEKDGKPGYAVKYPDGYTSWSPKDTFEAAYLPQGHDATRVSEAMVDAFIIGHESVRMGNHTVVMMVLRNGFTLIAESACASAENYDHKIGEQLALAKARNHVWQHLGFMLATARNGIRPAVSVDNSKATARSVADVYSHPDCRFNYCPTPGQCQANSHGCVIENGKR